MESEEKYRTVLENSLAAIYMFQDGGRFSYVNCRFVNLLGYDRPDEILGRPFWEIVAPEDRAIVKKRGLMREKKKVYPQRYSFRLIKKDGSIIWVDMRSSHASHMGKPVVVGNFIDITKEKQSREEVQLLSRKLIDAIEEERRSLASDLHDEFGQALTLIQLDVEALHESLPKTSPKSKQICQKMLGLIQRLAVSIRNKTSRLRPDLLDHLGLVPTLDWHIDDFNQRMIDIRIDFRAVGFKRRLAIGTEICIYRIFQEGLNNVAKHAGASHINILLTCSHPRVIFMMKDNGKGFEQAENGLSKGGVQQGIGLFTMKERVASLKGNIDIKSVPGKGTVIWVELPIDGMNFQ